MLDNKYWICFNIEWIIYYIRKLNNHKIDIGCKLYF